MSESDVITFAHPSDARNFRVGMRVTMSGYNGIAHLGPKLDDVVRDYALWIDQRYSHRFLGLGPTAWDNALVELDAKAEGREVETTIEVDAVDRLVRPPRKAISVKQLCPIFYDNYRLSRHITGDTDSDEDEFVVEDQNDYGDDYIDRTVTRLEMLEEKRRERNHVARRRKEHDLYKPIAQQPWMWCEVRRERSNNLSSFDSIMKSLYTDDAINAIAKYDNPMYAMLKKTSAQPNTVYVNPVQYDAIVTAIDKVSGTITVGHDPGFVPPAEITAFGGMKVIASASVPKDKAYLLPANIADYLNVDSDE